MGAAFFDVEVVVAEVAPPAVAEPVEDEPAVVELALVVELVEMSLVGSRVPHLAWMLSVQFFWPAEFI